MRSARFLLLMSGMLILIAMSLALSTSAIEGDPPPGGNWDIMDQVEYIGKTGYVEGSLNIMINGQLTIEDSTLVINHSLMVDSYGTLIVTNSTIKFKGSLTVQNRFDVMAWGTVTITDEDNDRSTTDDASVIMSDTLINYQWLVMDNATFVVRNSFISDCGLYSPGPLDDDGLRLLTNHAVIEGTNITDGYYGLIAEGVNGLRMENTTISDCQTGLILIGTRDCTVTTSRFINNVDYGLEVRGFNGNLVISDNEMSGNGRVNLYMFLSSGFANELYRCTVGPGGNTGILIEETMDWEIRDIRVTQCQVGIDIDLSTIALINTSVSECPVGTTVKGVGTVQLVDLQLAETTISVDALTVVNLSAVGSMTWTDVVGDLACPLEAQSDATLTMERCQIAFSNRGAIPSGLHVYTRGTIHLFNSSLDSPTSGEWTALMDDGSRVEIKWTSFSDLGTTTGETRERGLFIGGGGNVEEVTISDSLVGFVVGRANANFINITILDCLTGIVADGDLGKGGAEVFGLDMEGCVVAVRAINSGMISVTDGTFHLGSSDGFNMTEGTIVLRDCWVSDPATGMKTAILRDLSSLDLVNSVVSQVFDIGPNFNTVNIYWYLNLTLRYLSNDAPVSEGLVTIREASGTIVHTDLEAGIDGALERIELREKSLTPNAVITTPHTVTVSKDGLQDSFSILMDGSKDHTFNLDNYPPVLVVNYPENGAMLNASMVTFLGEAWDAVITETEGLASMNYRVDGGDWMPIEIPAVKAWSFDVTLDDGFHAVEVEVYDRIGNHNSSIVTVEVNTRLPSLILLSPAEGLITKQAELLVIGQTEPGMEVRINGVQVDGSKDGSFNETIDLVEGLNVVVVTATDALENTAVETRNVTLDTIPPEVVLDDPGPYITKEPTYTLSGSKEVNTTIYVNGYLLEYFDSDRFTTTVDLDEGLNPVLIFSLDQAGNNWSKTIIIERDSTPPSLSVARLPEHTNKVTITVQGSTDDPDANITVNGEEVTLSGLTFAYTLTLAEGENTITVEAEDPLGNAAEPDVQVVNVDTVLPVLEVYTPKYVKTFDDEQDLSGETEPGLPVVVFVSYGGAYTMTYNLVADAEGAFEVTVALPQVGNHSVTVTAIDLAGNKATEELYFDRVRPDVEPPPEPEQPSWFEENWTLVILLAAVIGAGAVLLFTFASVKQRKEAMRARAQARMEAQEELEDESPDEVDDEEEAEDDQEEAEEGEAGEEEAEVGEAEEAPEEDEDRS